MKDTLIKTLLHVVAVAVPLAVALVLIKVLGIENNVAQGAIGLALVALEAFVRKSDNVPFPDYVNDR